MTKVIFSESSVVQPFDYLREQYSLSTEVYAILEEETGGIRGEAENAVQYMLKIGVRLARVRSVLPRGAWVMWLRNEFAWTKRTAERWISVVKHLEEYELLEGFLSGEYEAEKTALYELATNRVTDEVRREAFAKVMGGEFLTYRSVTVMIQSLHDLTQSASVASRFPETVQLAVAGSEEAIDPNIIPLLDVLDAESPEHLESVIASGTVETRNGDDQIPLSETRPGDVSSLINYLRREEVQVSFAEKQAEFSVVRMTIRLPLDSEAVGSVTIEYFRPDRLLTLIEESETDGAIVGDYPSDFLYSAMWGDDTDTWAEFALPASMMMISFVE